MGDDEFEAEIEYEYDIPGDVDAISGISVSCSFLNQPLDVSYWTSTNMDNEGNPVFSVYFHPGSFDKFAATIMFNYTPKKARQVILRGPYSSIMSEETYLKDARRKIMNSFVSWPYCNKCHTDKYLRTSRENSKTGNPELEVYLDCKC
jgi:hypothetical protein